MKFNTLVQIYSVGFLHLQLIHILALSPQVMVYIAWVYLLGTYRCGIRILLAMVWSQGGADYTASPFPEHNYWSCGTGF